MIRGAVRRGLSKWSVGAVGLALCLLSAGYVLSDPRWLGDEVLAALVPVAVGIGLLVGGLRLRTTAVPRRTARIAVWTVAGGALGAAMSLWLSLLPSLRAVLPAAPAPLLLNGGSLLMAAAAVAGYYATGLRRRDRELQAAEARFRALTENAPFAVITVDGTGRVRYANDGVFDLFGVLPADLVGDSIHRLLPEAEQGRGSIVETLHASADSATDSHSLELVGRRADGEEFPLEIAFGRYTVMDSQLFTGVIQDISERSQARQRLQTYSAMVTDLHDLATEIAAADTEAAVCRRAVDGALELFDCDEARVLAMEGGQFVPLATSGQNDPDPEALSSVTTGIAGETLRTGSIARIADLSATRSAAVHSVAGPGDRVSPAPSIPDGAAGHRSLLSVPLNDRGVLQFFARDADAFTDRDEEVADMLATHVATAIERVRAQETIRRERDRLEEFAGVLSHDIRNPLHVADARLRLARDADDPAEHLDTAETALARIERLVEDVLTLARQGETVGETEPVPLESAAREAWGTVESHDATLDVSVEGTVEADRGRLVEVFENLYRNAIEHGGAGVTITVGALDRGFFVADTGPGVAPADREKIFESGHSTSEDGTGFGLAIVRRIVDAHGWEISVTEGADGGARFEINTA